MRLTFIGADHEVTGSCHFLEVGDTKLVVDYGMEQGQNLFENAPLPVAPSELDACLLTHAHIDHAGLLPLLYARGFRGRVITTAATGALCNIMLKDSAHIQEMEAEWKNRKAVRAGGEVAEPLYTMEDAEKVLGLFETYDYHRDIPISESVSARLIDAGHLLGSASIEVTCTQGGQTRKVVFSGDIGNSDKPLIRNPEYITDADYVVMECTYGDRLHERGTDHLSDISRIIQETLDRGGNVVIPAFAVGRTQELLYFIRRIKEEGMIRGHDGFPVVVDSPLAVEATHVFSENLLYCYDDETKALVERGVNPIDFPGLTLSVTTEDSKQINFDTTPKVIISASGMCDAGRIRHHLKHNLWRAQSCVVFAGFQAVGTLGRLLTDGADEVKIFGESISVEAKIEQLPAMSSHADRDGLLRWIGAFGGGDGTEPSPDRPGTREEPQGGRAPRKVFAVHGDDEVCDAFCDLVKAEYGFDAQAPFSGSVFDLVSGEWVTLTEPVLTEKYRAAGEAAAQAAALSAPSGGKPGESGVKPKVSGKAAAPGKAGAPDAARGAKAVAPVAGKGDGAAGGDAAHRGAAEGASTGGAGAKPGGAPTAPALVARANAARRASVVYARLLAAAQRLQSVAAKQEGGANKDLAKFADQINALCEKWE
ncbi:MAG: MBL fold metallo-hydrolase [Lachnospiraceae bacterium]|jgi:metallo-beta-lactamase family protein|nr:MBL fold metallo-hydrolase [Lachnospiraceae bacterium]